jgi:hypothetical protein
MGYTNNITFSKGHATFVAPLIEHLPQAPSEAPLSFTVTREDANTAAYHWRNYFNFVGSKPNYRVSIVEIGDPLRKGIEITYKLPRKISMPQDVRRAALSRKIAIPQEEIQRRNRTFAASVLDIDEEDEFFKSLKADIRQSRKEAESKNTK